MTRRIGEVVQVGSLFAAVLGRYGFTAEDVAFVTLPNELDALCEKCKTGTEVSLATLGQEVDQTVARVLGHKAEWPAFRRWMSENTWRAYERNRGDFNFVMRRLDSLLQEIKQVQQPQLF